MLDRNHPSWRAESDRVDRERWLALVDWRVTREDIVRLRSL